LTPPLSSNKDDPTTSFFVSILVVGDIGGALNTPHIGAHGRKHKGSIKIEKWSGGPRGDIHLFISQHAVDNTMDIHASKASQHRSSIIAKFSKGVQALIWHRRLTSTNREWVRLALKKLAHLYSA
jgi:hypothetical protein